MYAKFINQIKRKKKKNTTSFKVDRSNQKEKKKKYDFIQSNSLSQ